MKQSSNMDIGKKTLRCITFAPCSDPIFTPLLPISSTFVLKSSSHKPQLHGTERGEQGCAQKDHLASREDYILFKRYGRILSPCWEILPYRNQRILEARRSHLFWELYRWRCFVLITRRALRIKTQAGKGSKYYPMKESVALSRDVRVWWRIEVDGNTHHTGISDVSAHNISYW
jgi:hypothetical protein